MTGEAWRQYLQTYVALRRAIGFTMQREVRLLQDFVEHLERRGHDAPVAQVAVEWATASTSTKFRKSRLVPLHPTTAAALRAYAEQRRVLGYDGLCSAFYADLRIMPM